MPKRKAHALPETFRLVSLAEIAREIDRSPKETRRLLHQLRGFGVFPRLRHKKQGRPVLYNARVIEQVKALVDVPHRHIGHGPGWLDAYLGDKHDGAEPGHPRPPQP